MSRIQISVHSLPERLRAELKNLGYHRTDVCVTAAAVASISSAGSAGEQAFAVVLYGNGRRQAFWGSWGGPGIGSNADNPVDNLRSPPFSVPPDGAIITGSMRRTAVSVSIYVTQELFATLHNEADAAIARDAHAEGRTDVVSALQQKDVPIEELTEQERRVLYCYGALKSGEYRKNALAEVARAHACDTAQIIGSLVERGYLKRAANGATQITTLGKNARRMSNPMISNVSEIW